MPAQGRVVREDLPGQLDHVGDVDEFDAALVRGAGGVPAEPESASEAELAVEEQESEPRTARRRAAKDGRGNGSLGGDAAVAVRRPSQPIGARVAAFLRASWAELQRVQWPDRRQVTQATAVVLGFVAVMGVYLGVADWAAQKIVNFII